jgi:hypothetical protein
MGGGVSCLSDASLIRSGKKAPRVMQIASAVHHSTPLWVLMVVFAVATTNLLTDWAAQDRNELRREAVNNVVFWAGPLILTAANVFVASTGGVGLAYNLVLVGVSTFVLRRYMVRWSNGTQTAFGPYGTLAAAVVGLLFVTSLFGLVTASATRIHWLAFNLDGRPAHPSPRQLDVFYVWQLVHSVPALELTDTFQWREPLAYSASAVGVIVFVYKLAVIIPAIALGTKVWRSRHPTETHSVDLRSPSETLQEPPSVRTVAQASDRGSVDSAGGNSAPRPLHIEGYFRPGRAVHGIAVSSDGGTVVTGHRGQLRSWAVKPRPEMRTHVNTGWLMKPGYLAVSPNGELAVTSYRASARLWDLRQRAIIEEFHHSGYIRAAAFSGDGRELAMSTSRIGRIVIWALESCDARAEIEADDANLMSLAFGGRGSWLAATTGQGGVCVFEVESGKLIRDWRQLSASTTGVRGVLNLCAATPEGDLVAASGYFRKDVWIWSVSEDGPLLCVTQDERVHLLSWLRTSQELPRLVIGTSSGLAVWDVAACAQCARIETPNADFMVVDNRNRRAIIGHSGERRLGFVSLAELGSNLRPATLDIPRVNVEREISSRSTVPRSDDTSELL